LSEDIPFDIQLTLENEDIDNDHVIQLNENNYEEIMEPKNETLINTETEVLVEEIVETVEEKEEDLFNDVDYWAINEEVEEINEVEETTVTTTSTPLNTNVRRLIYSKNA